MERTIIKKTDRFEDTEFYKWLMERHLSGVKDENFIHTVITYMKNGDAPFRGRLDSESHKFVFEYFQRVSRKTLTFH